MNIKIELTKLWAMLEKGQAVFWWRRYNLRTLGEINRGGRYMWCPAWQMWTLERTRCYLQLGTWRWSGDPPWRSWGWRAGWSLCSRTRWGRSHPPGGDPATSSLGDWASLPAPAANIRWYHRFREQLKWTMTCTFLAKDHTKNLIIRYTSGPGAFMRQGNYKTETVECHPGIG